LELCNGFIKLETVLHGTVPKPTRCSACMPHVIPSPVIPDVCYTAAGAARGLMIFYASA